MRIGNSLSGGATEAKRREVEEAARKVKKAAKRAAKQAADAAETAAAEPGKTPPAETPAATAGSAVAAKPAAAPQTPICFLFPGQGSQALGMLNVRVQPVCLDNPDSSRRVSWDANTCSRAPIMASWC